MKRGFTLIELIIVVVIIGILAVIALPRYYANIQTAYESEAKATLFQIRQAQLAYYTTKGGWATAFPIKANRLYL